MDKFLDSIEDIIGSTADDLTWIQMSVRAIIVFIVAVVYIKATGKRIFSNSAPIDIVLSVIIGSILSRALTGKYPFFPILAATGIVILLHKLISHFAFLNTRISLIIKGKEAPLVKDGKKIKEILEKEI